MEKIFKENLNLWELSTDAAHILHKKGSDNFPKVRRLITQEPDAWEEIVVADVPKYTATEYAQKVEALIRRRYSVSDEIALINNILNAQSLMTAEDTANTSNAVDEYSAYQSYRAECKVEAKTLLSNPDVEAL